MGKEAMKLLEFQKNIGGTVECIKRLPIATKGCGQLTSNDTYFSGIWYSYVKIAGEAMSAGVNYFRTTKMSHKGFSLATI